jgi:hypothetical protein
VYQNTNDVRDEFRRQDDDTVRDAARFGVIVTLIGLIFVVVAAVWVSTCSGATADTAACGAPQRTVLALGAPVILLSGGLWSFVRTYQAWRRQRTWWAWQGAGWFLLTLMLVMLATSMPALAGPVFGR